MVILDTNILIDHLRRPKSAVSWLRGLVQEFGEINLEISTITIQELFIGHSTLNTEALSILEQTLSQLQIADYDAQVAQKAGELMRDSNRELNFADAAIAATALHRRAQLATLNRKDFEEIPGLELVQLDELSSIN
jgi:predicted nucleic acid-binding protein